VQPCRLGGRQPEWRPDRPAPRGGVIIVVDIAGRLVETFPLRAGCGIAADDDTFLATSGDGRIARLDEERPPASTTLHWDHHLAQIA
jgi:hypothetical protein